MKVKLPKQDCYSEVILRSRYALYKDCVEKTNQINKETGLGIRHFNPPEDLTENITKFILHNKRNDKSVVWARTVGKPGDLYSDIEQIIEVKAFTSGGPSSFGPKKVFQCIYFLDMQQWLDDKIILWRVPLSNTSETWKGLKMNKKKEETHDDQSKQGRRPHISWDHLYPQISTLCEKVYEGTFEGIFIPTPLVAPQLA
jgi:hypothetical protein